MASYRYKPRSTTPSGSIVLYTPSKAWNMELSSAGSSHLSYLWVLGEITHSYYKRTLDQSAPVLWSQPHSQAWPISIYFASLLASPDLGTLSAPHFPSCAPFTLITFSQDWCDGFSCMFCFMLFTLKAFSLSNVLSPEKANIAVPVRCFFKMLLMPYTHTHTWCLLGQRHTHKHINPFRRCGEREKLTKVHYESKEKTPYSSAMVEISIGQSVQQHQCSTGDPTNEHHNYLGITQWAYWLHRAKSGNI